MKIRDSIFLIGLGIGGTILYQQIQNGNFRKMIRQMNSSKTKMLEDLEEMM